MLTRQLRELERQADVIEQSKFEKLPKNEQKFRWDLFLESDGYKKNLSKTKIKEIAKNNNVNLKK